MAIENKWKESVSPESDPSEISEPLASDFDDTSNTVRSDWTMQRKMGVAMGMVGLILVMVGIAPMVLDSDTLKGSATDVPSASPEIDPLLSLFGAHNDSSATPTSNTSVPTTSTTPIAEQFATSDPVSETSHPETNPSHQTTADGVEVESSNLDTSDTHPSPTVSPVLEEASVVTPTVSAGTVPTTEIDKILLKESEVTPVSVNTNTGSTDTLGSEFMTENPNTTVNNGTFHASAGLQNTTVSSGNSSASHTQLTNSGPADSALILFLLSLFVAGGVRYRKNFLK